MAVPRPQAEDRLVELVSRACELVGKQWFLPPRDSREQPGHYRERVYCYELYHQLRTLTLPLTDDPSGPGYVLSGEMDKAGLNVVTEGGREKPDFIWHVPGSTTNAAVVEVKAAARWSPRGVEKDLRTLQTFLAAGDRAYRTGGLLIFGEPRCRGQADEVLRDRVRSAASFLEPEVRDRVRVLWHPEPKSRAVDLNVFV